MTKNSRLAERIITVRGFLYIAVLYVLYTVSVLLTCRRLRTDVFEEGLCFVHLVHLILMTGYLLFTGRHDSLFISISCRLRFPGLRSLFLTRFRFLLIETAFFALPYMVLICLTGWVHGAHSAGFLFLCCLNVFLSLLAAGIPACTIQLKKQKNYLGTLLVWLLLSLDYMAASGYFAAPVSIFYLPMLTPFRAAGSGTVFLTAAGSFCKVLLMLLLTAAFLRPRRSHRSIRLNGPAGIILRKSLWGIPFGILLSLFALARSLTSPEEALLGLFGTYVGDSLPLVAEHLLFALPLLVQLLLFGGIMAADREQAAVFLFTRSAGRRQWALKEMGTILGGSVLFSLLCGIFVLIPVLLAGNAPADPSALLLTAGALAVTVIPCQALFVLACNILTLRLSSPAYALWILLPLYAGGLIVSAFGRNIAGGIPVILYPSAQGILSVHNIPGLNELFPAFLENPIPAFRLWISPLYCLILSVFILWAGVRTVIRKDCL